MKTLFGGALLSAALLGCSSGYRLSLNVDKGDKFSYRVKTTVEEGGAATSLSMRIDMEVEEAASDRLTMKTRIRDFEIAGEPTTPDVERMLQSVLITTVVDRQGNQISRKTEGLQDWPRASIGDIGATIPFPDKPVRTGDTWESVVTHDGQKVNYQYKVVGEENVKGVNAVKIEAGITGDVNMKTVTPTRYWVDRGTGMPVKMEAVVEFQTPKMKVTTVTEKAD